MEISSNGNVFKILILIIGIIAAGFQNSGLLAAENVLSDTVEIAGPNGKLFTVINYPNPESSAKKPAVILMHGLTSSCEDPIISMTEKELNAVGIASVKFDFDGHGRSEGKMIDMTIPKEIEDADAVFDYISKHYSFASISLLGHSQGGVVASMLAGKLREKIRSIVLMAPAAVIEDAAKQGIYGGDTINSQSKLQNIPDSIPMFNHFLGKEWAVTAATLQVYKNSAGYAGAVCIIQGKADKLVPYSYSEKYKEIYTNCELNLLDGFSHSFKQDLKSAVMIAVKFLTKETNE